MSSAAEALVVEEATKASSNIETGGVKFSKVFFWLKFY